MKVGQVVQIPADRGDPAYLGVIEGIGEQVCTNHLGSAYVWLTVRASGTKRRSVWPSNRLGFKIEKEKS